MEGWRLSPWQRGDLYPASEVAMRIGGVLVLIWLLIGVVAAAQRNYFSGSDANCAKLGTVAVTVVAGPLNYAGVNPKVKCQLPQPSR
jgi:membrane protein YdbS with pleckstrin-like domain